MPEVACCHHNRKEGPVMGVSTNLLINEVRTILGESDNYGNGKNHVSTSATVITEGVEKQ